MADLDQNIPPPMLPQDLFQRILAVEHGSPNAVSQQGASGTPQITQATFNDWKQPGEMYGNDNDMLAAAYRKVAADYDHFGGDPYMTAAAYIGGRGAVLPNGSIRNDVADANGVTPLKYASMVVDGAPVKASDDGYTPIDYTVNGSAKPSAGSNTQLPAPNDQGGKDEFTPLDYTVKGAELVPTPVKAQGKTSLGRDLKDAGSAFVSGLVSIGTMVAKMGQYLGREHFLDFDDPGAKLFSTTMRDAMEQYEREFSPGDKNRGMAGDALQAISGAGAQITAAAIMGGPAILSAFGGGAAEDKYEQMIRSGKPESDALNAARMSGSINAVAGLVVSKIAYGVGGKIASDIGKGASPTMGAVISKVSDDSVLMPFVKGVAAAFGANVAAFEAQNFGERAINQNYGLPSAGAWSTFVDGLKSSLAFTAAGSPMVGLAAIRGAKQKSEIGKALSDANADQSDRLGAVLFTANVAQKSGVPVNDVREWTAAATHAVLNKDPISAYMAAPDEEPKLLVAPGPITVDANGNAITPEQSVAAASRAADMGLTPDVARVAAAQRARESTPTPTPPVAALPAPTDELLATGSGHIGTPGQIQNQALSDRLAVAKQQEQDTALGITPGTRRIIDRQQSVPVHAPIAALPAPTDILRAADDGQIGTPGQMQNIALDQRLSASREEQRKSELGLTPDIQRILAPKTQDIAQIMAAPTVDAAADAAENMAATVPFANAGDELRARAVSDSEARLPENQVPEPQNSPGTVTAPATLSLHSSILGRLKNPDIRHELELMGGEAGWSETGGKLLRDADGNVTGRTKWIPNADWWPGRPDSLNERAVRAAVQKAVEGRPLKVSERRTISYMLDIAEERVRNDLTPQESASLTGFDDAIIHDFHDDLLGDGREVRPEEFPSDGDFLDHIFGRQNVRENEGDGQGGIPEPAQRNEGAVTQAPGASKGARGIPAGSKHAATDQNSGHATGSTDTQVSRPKSVLEARHAELDPRIDALTDDEAVKVGAQLGIPYVRGEDIRAKIKEAHPDDQERALRDAGVGDGSSPTKHQSRNTKPASERLMLPSQVVSIINRHFGRGTTALLQRAGVLDILAEHPGGDRLIQGEYDPRRGRAILYAANLEPHTVIPVVYHEIGEHYGLKTMLGDEDYARLVRDLRLASGNGDVRASVSRIKNAYPEFSGSDTRSLFQNERFVHELLAHLGENEGARSMGWFTRMVEGIKRFLRTTLGIGQVNAREVGYLLNGSLRHVIRNLAGHDTPSELRSQGAVSLASRSTEQSGFDLTGETEAQIRAREALKEHEQRNRKRSEQSPSPDNFTLTGSDRPADEAEARGQQPLFSRFGSRGLERPWTDVERARVIDGWRRFAAPEAFAYPVSKAKALPDIMREVAPKFYVVHKGAISGYDDSWVLYPTNQRGKPELEKPSYVLQYPDGKVEINVANLGAGEQGSRLYSAVANYAHNNGLIFSGDRMGISDIGKSRRLENMISSALKFKTTSHIEPHPDMLVDMGWKTGDHDYNLGQMLEASFRAANRAVPDIEGIVYDFGAKKYSRIPEDNTDHPERSTWMGEGNSGRPDANHPVGPIPLNEQYVSRLGNRSGGGSAQIGERTLKRAILTRTFLQGDRDGNAGLVEPQALGSVLYSRKPPEDRWYYSVLEHGVRDAEDRYFDKPANQVKVWLQANASRLGVKKAEIQWSGVGDWLDLQGKNKVSKGDILNYLKDGGIQVREVMKYSPESAVEALSDVFQKRGFGIEDSYGDVIYTDADGDFVDFDELPKDLQQAVNEFSGGVRGETKYDQWAMPGGKHYRELLLTLPPRELPTELPKELPAPLSLERNSNPHGPAWEVKAPDMIGRYASGETPEQAIRRFYELHGKNFGVAGDFKSQHWNEPNVLAHVRFNDRVDAEGNKTLFIEELQSDWGQRGKKTGFVNPVDEIIGRAKREGRDLTPQETARVDQIGRERGFSGGETPDAPFVTDTKAWTALALKRMIAYAAEHGYDKIAFVNGDQSVARYDLSKQMDRISYLKSIDGKTVSLEGMKADRQVFHKPNYPMSDLANLVGKEIADKIEHDAGETNFTTGYKDLSGLDLKVGGEGMKAFYDQIVPQVASDMIKRYGGKLEQVKFGMSPRFKIGQDSKGWYFEDEHGGGESGFATEAEARAKANEYNAIEHNEFGLKEQTGFTITPEMRQSAMEGMPLFSRRPSAPEWASTPDEAEAARRAGAWQEKPSIADRLNEMRESGVDRFVQSAADAFAPLKGLDERAYKLARLAKNTSSGLMRVLLEKGIPYIDSAGGGRVHEFHNGFLGMLKEFKDVGEDPNRFFSWMIGNRSQYLVERGRLAQQEVTSLTSKMRDVRTKMDAAEKAGDVKTFKSLQDDHGNLYRQREDAKDRAAITERNLTPQHIQYLKGLDQGTVKEGGSRAEFYARMKDVYNTFGKGILDLAEGSGIINSAGRKSWENEWHIPFYRLADEDQVKGPGGNLSGLVNQKGIKQLKGGTEALNDPLENILMNWSHLITASLKNRAAGHALEIMEKDGWAEQVPSGTKGSVFVLKDGKQMHYQVDDPFLLEAVTSLDPQPFMHPAAKKAMALFKHLETIGWTVAPAFRIAHTLREQLTAVAANPTTYNIFKNWVSGFKLSSPKNPNKPDMIAGGSFMDFSHHMDKAEMVREMAQRGIRDFSVLDTPQKIAEAAKGVWHWWGQVGERADEITRANLYQQIYERELGHGATEDEARLEAAYRALDVMDFGLTGKGKLVRFFAGANAFWNARFQGLYKLGRGAKEDPKRMATVLSALALGSLALYLSQKDDPDIQALGDDIKDSYWPVKVGTHVVLIPKPFELGAFATVVTRGYEALANGLRPADRQKFLDRSLSILGNQLDMNPVPQIIRPFVGIYANKDSYQGHPIETEHQRTLLPEDRVNPGTSFVARQTGKLESVLSPVQLDYVIKGYFGWIGTTVLNTTNALASGTGMQPSQPSWRTQDIPVIGRFVRDLPNADSVFVNDFYSQQQAVTQIMGSLKDRVASGDIEGAKALMADHAPEITASKIYSAVGLSMTKLNKAMRQAEESDLSPDEKRARIDSLTQARNELARKSREAAISAGAP